MDTVVQQQKKEESYQSSRASFLKLLRAITNIIAITLISYHFDCLSLA